METKTFKIASFPLCGETYYDYALTKIEKNNLLKSIDEIKRPFASKETTRKAFVIQFPNSHV